VRLVGIRKAKDKNGWRKRWIGVRDGRVAPAQGICLLGGIKGLPVDGTRLEKRGKNEVKTGHRISKGHFILLAGPTWWE